MCASHKALVEVGMYLKQCQLVVLENVGVNALWLHVRPAYCILFFLIWAGRVCNIWLYAQINALFNICGLPELLVLRSGLFLSELVIFLCLFLNPCFTLPGSHLQEEEMEEFGVSGWRQRAQTFILPLPFALFPTCYLICWCFDIFSFVNPFLLTIHFHPGVLLLLMLKNKHCKL